MDDLRSKLEDSLDVVKFEFEGSTHYRLTVSAQLVFDPRFDIYVPDDYVAAILANEIRKCVNDSKFERVITKIPDWDLPVKCPLCGKEIRGVH